jgi:cytoskeletal protein CcmA (bactofilin family)
MAQIIKHRRGSIANVGTLSPVNAGEIVLGTGSIGTLNGPVLFVGDSSSYKAVPQLYYGSSVPNISSYSQLEGVSFYDTTGKNLYILKAAGNTRLDLAGAISGSAITPSSVTTGIITGSDLYLSGNAKIDGNITLGGNLTIGDANTDFVNFAADISSSLTPDIDVAFDLGASGSRWRTIYAQQGVFTSASGSFSGSFVGNGAGLTGLATNLLVYGDGGLSGSINLLDQNLKVLGTANEIETTLALNSGSDGYTVQIGLPDNVTINQSLTVNTDLYVTGSSYTSVIIGSGSIHLQPDLNNSNYLEVYNTVPSDVHIKSSTDVTYVGNDTTYVKVITDGDTITINAPSGVFINGNLQHSGSSAEFFGNVTVAQKLTVSGGLEVTGSSNIEDLYAHSGSFTHSVTVGNGLYVTGSAVIQNNISASSGWFSGSVEIGGNLTVNGTSTLINSTTVEIGDNIISLNGTGVANAGLVVKDPTSPYTVSGSLLWDSTSDYWKAGQLGSEKRIAVQSSSSLTTNALLYGNSTSEIVSMDAPVTTGSLAQWTGTAWIMSNIIDGGTF